MNKIIDKFKSCPEILSFLLFILGGCVIVFITNNFFTVFAPFIIAYIVARILRPLMVKMHDKIKIPNILSAILCMLIFVTVAVLIVWGFCHYLIEGISYVIGLLSSTSTINLIVSFAQDIWAKLEDLINFLRIDTSMDDISGTVGDFAKRAIEVLSNFSINLATQIPGLLMSLIIGCVAAFYMLYDYKKLSMAISEKMSPKTKSVVSILNGQVFSSFAKMILSYILISAICFCELLLGFTILGIKDSVFIALIIAILDVLPILGSGAILIPWGIIALLVGKPLVGIGVLVLWGVIVVVRQIVEPKIVGSQIGLHPLLTLASLYVGLKLMGGLGLIVGPLYVIAYKKLNEDGVIGFHLKKEKEQEESDSSRDEE